MTNLSERQRIVAVYARVSTKRQATEGHSLEGQIERLSLVAGWRFPGRELRVYQDADSGTNDRRPGFRALQREVQSRNVHAVVGLSIDRLWRNLIEGMKWLEELRVVGTHLVIWSEMVDTSSAMGRAWLAMQLTMAELESNRIGERVKAGHDRSSARGQKGPGLRPFGWRVGPDRMLMRDEPEQSIIVFVAAERGEGRSWQSCAMAVNRLGVTGVLGRPFTGQGLASCYDSAVERLARETADPSTPSK